MFGTTQWLNNKIAVVTGAASGIGLAISQEIIRQGGVVHLVDIRAGALEKAVSALEGQGRAKAHVADVASFGEMRTLAEALFAEHHRVDLLVNNAGVCIGGAFVDISVEQWERSIRVNIQGVVNGIKAFLPFMLQQPVKGRIINMSSAAGLMGIPYISPYSATKAASIALSHALSAELSDTNVTVTVVCPGAVNTELLNNSGFTLPGDWGERVRSMLRGSASAEKAAIRILTAARKGKRCAFMFGGGLRPLWLMYRYLPGLYGVVTDFLGRLGRKA